MPFKSRRTDVLRKGRISIPGAIYFLTWCTANRARSLASSGLQATARQAIANLEQSGNGAALAATIMPDHIHLLLELDTPLTVSQVAGKLKSAITRAHGELKWQKNFFEHQL
jgi:putative transposase